jgi:hypothetical protein
MKNQATLLTHPYQEEENNQETKQIYKRLAIKPFEEFWQEFQDRNRPSYEELDCLIAIQARANYSSPLA